MKRRLARTTFKKETMAGFFIVIVLFFFTPALNDGIGWVVIFRLASFRKADSDCALVFHRKKILGLLWVKIQSRKCLARWMTNIPQPGERANASFLHYQDKAKKVKKEEIVKGCRDGKVYSV